MSKRYDSYKDSGVEWIGEIPSHWTNLKLGYVGKLKSGNGFSDRLQGRDNGDYPFFKVSDTNNLGNDVFLKESNNYVSEDDYLIEKWFLFPKNTIVFPKIGMVLLMNKRRILNQSSFIDNNMMGFIPNGKLNYKYGYYYLTKVDLKDYCSDGTVPSIGESQINPIKFPLPPLSEQQQIVSFLDNKTTLIDSLIEKTQRKIELLKEKRTSLINEVVTKGLNPNVEMKDSGVEWIGKIPSHWTVSKIMFISSKVTDGSHHSPETQDVGRLYVTVSNVTKENKIDFESCSKISEESFLELERNGCRPEKGDVLITKDGTIGRGLVVGDFNDYVILSSIGLIRFSEKIVSKYGLYYLLSGLNIDQMYSHVRGSGITRLTINLIKNLLFVIPSYTEQQQIVEYLDEQTGLIDKTISIEEKRIELLKEYRQSLISEVVTGKRKVLE